MPDDEVLAGMYGLDYYDDDCGVSNTADPKEPQRVIDYLRSRKPGCFLDYGCGAGLLLEKAAELGWESIGVEFAPDVVERVARKTRCRVVSAAELESADLPLADVLHLGDVIEHLTDTTRQMRAILALLRANGTLMAQGPLEANPTFFTLMLRLVRSLKPSRPVEMAPYHVHLATADGQRRLFQRFGLDEQEYRIREVAWPAPNHLTLGDLVRARPVALFTVRRFSQAISAIRPGRWGNRYFYVGLHRN